MEDRQETVEFYFYQAYQKACRTIQSITSNDTPSQSKPGLQAIASAAAAGLANASVTDVADDILKFPTLPKIPYLQNVECLPKNVVQNLEPNNLPLILLLDLMFSSAKSWDVCNKLMDTVKPHLKNSKQIADVGMNLPETKSSVAVSKQRVSRIRTFPEFITHIQAILDLGTEDEIPSKEQMMLSKTFQKSIQHLLCKCTSSFTAEKNKEYVTLCQNLAKYTAKVDEAFRYTRKSSHMTPESPRGSPSSSSTGPRSQQEKVSIHHSMKQLIHTLEKDVPASGILALVNRYVYISI